MVGSLVYIPSQDDCLAVVIAKEEDNRWLTATPSGYLIAEEVGGGSGLVCIGSSVVTEAMADVLLRKAWGDAPSYTDFQEVVRKHQYERGGNFGGMPATAVRPGTFVAVVAGNAMGLGIVDTSPMHAESDNIAYSDLRYTVRVSGLGLVKVPCDQLFPVDTRGSDLDPSPFDKRTTRLGHLVQHKLALLDNGISDFRRTPKLPFK